MFGYILYYVVALLIYSSYQPVEAVQVPLLHLLILFFSLIFIFIALTWFVFKKIESRIGFLTFKYLDHQFNSTLNRQSLFAIGLYAVDIYGLNLAASLNQIKIFKLIPTLEAVFFLLLFISYLTVIWVFAYIPYQKIYKTGIKRNEYVFSNIFFSLPILFPWLILSLSVDVINTLPFEAPKHFLMSSEGQISFFICFLIVAATIGPALIQKFWKCIPLAKGTIRQRIELMCKNADMKFKEILIWPLFGGKMVTAGVMGLVKQFRYILVTPALLQLLDPFEIEAVIAHEIGHIKQKHLIFYLFFFIGYLILAFSALNFIIYVFMYFEAATGFIITGGSNNTLISLYFNISMIFIFLIYFRYVFGFFMRNFERQADIYAYSTIGTPLPLISTFEKISLSSGQSPEKPNWHHFSIQERISYLVKCAADGVWIDRHNAKIKKSIWVYFSVIVILSWVGFKLNHGALERIINSDLLKKTILKRIEIDPNNADLYQMLGDIYYRDQDYNNTITSYQNSLKYNPNQIQALNNLAWLYATCENKNLRSPEKALKLAEHSASLSKESYILDTLAEAYFVNSDFKAAVEIEEKALANDNRSDYQGQLTKFKNAAKLP